MCDALYRDFPQIKNRFQSAGEILGYDIGDVIARGPLEKLNQTEITQPAMLVASIATWDAWLASGGALPDYFAGHSFGEYSALVCANAIRFEDAVVLAAKRGRFMQEAVSAEHSSVCAVIGLEENVLKQLCAKASEDQVVQCANINAPGQVVLAGNREAVERASKLATNAGAKKIIPLAVSAPVHCDLMLPAATRLAEHINKVQIETPEIPVIHNVDAKPRKDVMDIRSALISQMASPVLWRNTIEYFVENSVTSAIECGPGKVLCSLVRRTTKSIKTYSLSDKDSIAAVIEDFNYTADQGAEE
tara:strand:+ start:494 stop:1405 length:912 start_codon:yes stop_codon:yes gene_type:complete